MGVGVGLCAGRGGAGRGCQLASGSHSRGRGGAAGRDRMGRGGSVDYIPGGLVRRAEWGGVEWLPGPECSYLTGGGGRGEGCLGCVDVGLRSVSPTGGKALAGWVRVGLGGPTIIGG